MVRVSLAYPVQPVYVLPLILITLSLRMAFHPNGLTE